MINVQLNNLKGETRSVLTECFEVLKERICNLSIPGIARESRERKIHGHSTLSPMADQLAKRMDADTFSKAMDRLENETRSQSPEKWMLVSNLFHGIGNHTSIWASRDACNAQKVRIENWIFHMDERRR